MYLDGYFLVNESAANYTNNESAARYNGDVVLLIFKVSWLEIEYAAGEYAANYTEVSIVFRLVRG